MAGAFVFYFKAQTFHWNVEGPNFPQYHDFFGTVYTTVYGSIDRLAEEIRMLGSYAPTSLADVLQKSGISESTDVQSTQAMFNTLLADNKTIMNGLTEGFKMAEEAGELGLANYLQDLLDNHKKLAWMISSTSKG